LLGAPGERVDDVDGALAELGVASAALASPSVADTATPPPAPAPAASGPHPRIFSSPLARRLAREAGIDPASLTGTGPNGRILRRDVEAAVASRGTPPAPPAPHTAAPETAPAPASAGGYDEIPHSRMRRAIARRLVESKSTVPHFYLRATCRVDELLVAREQLNAVSPVRISVNDLVIKAVAWAHVLVPGMNVTWTDDALRVHQTVDIAIAVATEKGLVTPVLRNVATLPIGQVAALTRDFATRARDGQLRQDELEGGSISVSNLGMYGTEDFAAIINPPQAAILAVGAARPEAVVDAGGLAVATVMRVTLSVDHRSVDGALGAEWLRTFVGLIESPIRILA